MNASRESFLAQLERCMQGQRNAHTITPPEVPTNTESLAGFSECIPEEAMGNQEPPVHTAEVDYYDDECFYYLNLEKAKDADKKKSS